MRRTYAVLGSVVWFALAPGLVAGLVPWLLTGWRVEPFRFALPVRVAGAILVVLGAAVLVHAFVQFVVEGLGTPAPAAPPGRLVVGGLYRHVRNPMYVAVLAVVLGQAMVLTQPVLFGYAAAVAAVEALFVHGYEERTLRQTFGAAYDEYRRAVPAWLPRLRPWTPPPQ